MNQAMGTDNLEALAGTRAATGQAGHSDKSAGQRWKRLPDLLKMAGYPPKSVRSGICQQVVLEGDKANLTKLPIIQCWPLDGDLRSGQVFDPAAAEPGVRGRSGTGRYITLGGVHTRNPEDGSRNIGMYRVQLFGPRKCAMHWHMHHDGAPAISGSTKNEVKKMPLAVVLGGESGAALCRHCAAAAGD